MSPRFTNRYLDGAKFTVTRRSGQGSPLESRAARTRSRDSRTATSGQCHDGEAGQALGDVNLDRDRSADGAGERGGGYGSEHAEEWSPWPGPRAPAYF